MLGDYPKSKGHKVNPTLSTHIMDKLEKIKETLAIMCEESASGIPIVVEGKKDVDTLRNLGVTGPILTVKTGGKSFAQALQEIEEMRPPKIILLLDFDRRGRQAIRKLREGLTPTGIKSDLTFWCTLAALASKELQCIEGLTSYLDTLKRKSA